MRFALLVFPILLVKGISVPLVLPFSGAITDKFQNFNQQQQPVVPFPKWLSDFTGLKEWPGLDPPYIPLDFIDFSKIENLNIHSQGQCESLTPNSCSFDCSNCVSFDDVFTCPQLSQTFDDGPSPATTKLVNNLKVPSTFFTLGINVVKYPDTYKESVAKGNVMGSHTWSHKFLPSLTNEQIIAQMEWSIWAMNATGNHLPKWFRPPYGGVDNRVRSIVRQFGMQCVLWNVDTFDWKLISNEKTEHDIRNEINNLSPRTQGIMLEHDTSLKTVNMAIEISKKFPNQLTIPKCVGGIDYIKRF